MEVKRSLQTQSKINIIKTIIMNRKKLIILFFAVLALRIAIAIFMWPGIDETYYYVCALHPDLSYYDHPPMVALTGGLIPVLFKWVTPLSIRLGPIILFSLATYTFFLLARLLLTQEESLMATAIFLVTPLFIISGTFLLPDAALIFFWILSLYIFLKTIMKPKTINWILLGILLGLGMLSKYTMGFLCIGVFIFLLMNNNHRKLLLTPGPYITILISMIVFSPVIIWNIRHDFISFLFQTGRIGGGGFNFNYFFQSVGGQIGYLLPFIFFPAVYFAFENLFKLRRKNEFTVLFFSFGTVPVVFFLAASFFNEVLPHWPLAGYITLTLPVGCLYFNLLQKKKAFFNVIASLHILVVAVVIFVSIAQIYTGVLYNQDLTPTGVEHERGRMDISLDIIGWSKLAHHFSESNYSEDVFLFTHKGYLGGQITFATKGKYPVLCLNRKVDARGFSIWQKQEKHIGKDGIFICTSRFYLDPSKKYKSYFENIEFLESLPIERSGKIVKAIYLFRCENFKKVFPIN